MEVLHKEEFRDLFRSADWKTEKHVPVIDCHDSVKRGEWLKVRVSVGKTVSHPNTTDHHIRWMELYFHPEGNEFPFQKALQLNC